MAARILVVDDEADLELLIVQKFRMRIATGEFAFRFARDGEEALNVLAADSAIELVITDINMPGMDGLTLLAKLAALPRLAKTVIVSAYDDMENIRTAMNRGAYDFITKPIDFGDLERTIDKTLAELALLRSGQEARERLAVLDYELEVATKIQTSILPETLTGYEEFEISASMLPARQISGDFYDFFLIDQHRLGLAIGDVSGKGIPAALFMAVCRTLLRATALQEFAPEVCLDHVNKILLKQSDGEVYLTLFYCVVDLRTGECEFSAGAQTPPYLASPHSPGKFLTEPGATMLGLMPGVVYPRGRFRMSAGDSLVLYTDGATEAENARGEFFTDKSLRKTIETAKSGTTGQIVDAVIRDVRAFTADFSQSDDLTVLAFRYRPNESALVV